VVGVRDLSRAVCVSNGPLGGGCGLTGPLEATDVNIYESHASFRGLHPSGSADPPVHGFVYIFFFISEMRAAVPPAGVTPSSHVIVRMGVAPLPRA
jgi:hypothetical protein